MPWSAAALLWQWPVSMANALAVHWWLATRFCHAINRSFLKLKVIKTFLQSTMLQERRLPSLALSRPIENARARNIDIKAAVKDLRTKMLRERKGFGRVQINTKVGICIESIFFSKCSIYSYSFNLFFLLCFCCFFYCSFSYWKKLICLNIFFKQLASLM